MLGVGGDKRTVVKLRCDVVNVERAHVCLRAHTIGLGHTQSQAGYLEVQRARIAAKALGRHRSGIDYRTGYLEVGDRNFEFLTYA